LLYTGNGEAAGGFIDVLGQAQRELLLLIVTAIAAGLLRVLEPTLFRDTTKLLLLAMCCLLSIVPADSLLYFHQAVPGWSHSTVEFLIPLTLAPLLAGVLLGSAAATVTGLWVSCVCAVLFDNSLTVLVTGLIATATAASLAPRARRRTQIIRIGLVSGLSEVAGVVALAGVDPLALSALAHQSIGCAIDGIASALVVVMILPLFEALFGVTTKITLMELSDLGHPLLQRLAFEAPGTYHHSLMVANLAQAAADNIAANAVLARAGAYFHDIGKLTKPSFFSENMQGADNPHDTLAPSMSALIVMSHVKEGLSLAMLYRLPKAVRDVIEQHHGTGLAAYFHHKAGRQTPSTGQGNGLKPGRVAVDETPYRYPGPRPLSSEATIIMLADAVEAASRSMDKPSPSHICELVDRLVGSRFEDGQLDESGMTFSELACVKRAFVLCLTNMLHSRIAYPRS
jgi:putative nucleotidyltransferase with HDIG domain